MPTSEIAVVGVYLRPESSISDEIGAMLDRLDTACRAKDVQLVTSAPQLRSRPFFQYLDEKKLDSAADLVIAIGGDGTLLCAARLLAGTAVPVWGVHVGRLGFLTDVMPDEFEQALPRVLSGDHSRIVVEMITAEIVSPSVNAVVTRASAVNEISIETGQGRMITFAVEVDGELMTIVDGNGIIISTPAGSTAYNLAAGGPIVLGNTKAFVVSPICPHTLTNRPVIISNESVVKIILKSGEKWTHVAADGSIVHESLEPGTSIEIKRSGKSVTLIKTSRRGQFDVLKEKLGWGSPRRSRR